MALFWYSWIKSSATNQNQTTKIMDKKLNHFYHWNILQKYKLLSFSDLYFLKLTFKCLNLEPEPLSSFMQRQNSKGVTRGSINNNHAVPHHKTAFGQKI